MGKLVHNEPHEPRSSSKSFAMRWKHENMRIISVISLIVVAITVVSILVGFSYAKKSVSIVIDDVERQVESRKQTIGAVLDEQAIVVGEHDEVSPKLDTKVEEGSRITIERAQPIKVTVDGKSKKLFTTKDDVGEALQSHKIQLNKEDKVYPSQDAAIKRDMHIRVVRVKKDIVKREVKVPYTVVKKADPNMKKGTKKTVQKGKAGLVVQQIEKTYEDGKLVYKKMIDKNVKTKAVSQVITYGTKKVPEVSVLSADGDIEGSVLKDGVNFDYKRKLGNFQLTAYTETPGSAGATTASGTKVTAGRTISVDPKVIPLGWWVYIEGIGFRRAEDTGGAVKGKIIDLYFDSSKQVNRFGRKKGYTVYIIGPVKPEAN
ncbi:ubiquitin-like domain-containing protein [Paenibacillus arenosi]|uniref:DUF348 domain-containing protein n=1 Tax=Paenibacillus arenosi TaxID=2774142 RepID=A0ABR9B3E3_9BACL|nr:DUF348 domain-containing protein [Paenibacillus arenosi]